MKNLGISTSIVCALIFVTLSADQPSIKETLEKKIRTYLQLESEIEKYYELTDEALVTYASPKDKEKQKPELSIPFSKISEYQSTPLPKSDDPEKPLKGIRIALDPVGIGGEIMGKITRRLIKVNAGYEWANFARELDIGHLTFLVAKNIKFLLERKGAEVLITRNKENEGAYEKDFETWLKEYSSRPEVLQEKTKQLSLDTLKTDDTKELAVQQTLFTMIYNQLDMNARAQKINAFKPHITLIILFNYTSPKDKDSEIFEGTDNNHSLFYVPGAFCSGELQDPQSRKDFARLALSDTIEESIKLAQELRKEMRLGLGVTAESIYYDAASTSGQPKKNTMAIEDGIFCRNLAMPSKIESPVCYALPIYLDNYDMSKLFSREETIGCWALADIYAESIKNYIYKK